MKTNASKQPKQPKPAVQLKDIKPKKDAKGGGAYVKDVQKSVGFTGGVRVASADFGGDN